jgi:hypothetical protein
MEVFMNTQVPVVEIPVENTPTGEKVAAKSAETPKEAERTWSEEFEVVGNELVETVKTMLAEGNVRRLILRTPDNSVVIEIPLVVGAVVGVGLTVFAPLLAVVGAIASVLARVRVEIVRTDETPIKPEMKEPAQKVEAQEQL